MDIKDLLPWGRDKWSLDASFGSLQKEMNRIFDDFTRGLDTRSRSFLSHFDPKINVAEDAKSIQITAELPGMDEKDVDVSVNDYALTIKGEKKWEQESKEQDHHLVERSYGSFRRVIPLPQGVDTSSIKATFSKGVLKVEVAKSQKVQESTRKIDVKAG